VDLPESLRLDMLHYIRMIGIVQKDGLSLLTEKTYPEIDAFKVEIFPNEGRHRGRAHCRVTTDDGSVSVDIETYEIIAGEPGRWARSIRKAVEEHHAGLLALWNQTRPDDQRLSK
jgi:hypothetical protein